MRGICNPPPNTTVENRIDYLVYPNISRFDRSLFGVRDTGHFVWEINPDREKSSA